MTNKFTKFKQKLEKKGVNTTFSRITNWLSFPNAGLNYIVTGRFDVGIPNKRTVAICGPQGSGKSLLLGNICETAQKAKYHTIYIDTENAIDEPFLLRINVSLDEEDFTPIRISTIEEAADVLGQIFAEFDENDKIAVFLDSASMLDTEKGEEAFKKGELNNDMGLFAKKLKQLIKNINKKIGMMDMFFVYTLHVYANQDPTSGKGKFCISGGDAQMFVPSICIELDKFNLKEGRDQVGIRMVAKTIKTRYNQLGLRHEIELPWNSGMDFYFGIMELLEKEGVVSRSAAWYSYEKDGEVIKFQKNAMKDHVDYLLSVFTDKEIKEAEDFEEPLEDVDGQTEDQEKTS